MIATFVGKGFPALKIGRAAGEYGCATDTFSASHALKLVCPAGGRETLRQTDLISGKNIDDEMLGSLVGAETVGPFVQAPQDQRRIHRNGVETVGRDANIVTILIASRDDGDTSREMAQGMSESARIEFAAGHGCRPQVPTP